MRDPNRLTAEGHRHGREIGRFVAQLLAGTFTWAKLHQAQKLMRMTQKYGAERVKAACGRALSLELINFCIGSRES